MSKWADSSLGKIGAFRSVYIPIQYQWYHLIYHAFSFALQWHRDLPPISRLSWADTHCLVCRGQDCVLNDKGRPYALHSVYLTRKCFLQRSISLKSFRSSFYDLTGYTKGWAVRSWVPVLDLPVLARWPYRSPCNRRWSSTFIFPVPSSFDIHTSYSGWHHSRF